MNILPIDAKMMEFRASADTEQKLKLRMEITKSVEAAINTYDANPPDVASLNEWQDGALCKSFPEVMFAEKGEIWATRLAQTACASCVVQGDCLEYALSDKAVAPFGVWGKWTDRQRRAYFKRRKAA